MASSKKKGSDRGVWFPSLKHATFRIHTTTAIATNTANSITTNTVSNGDTFTVTGMLYKLNTGLKYFFYVDTKKLNLLKMSWCFDLDLVR